MKNIIRRLFQFQPANGSADLIDPTINAIREYSMCDLGALQLILRLSLYVNDNGIAGDLVECGVCNGGSAALIASKMRRQDLRLWLYDSFAGMPVTQEVDGIDARDWIGKCIGTKENVLQALQLAGVSLDQVVIKEGRFEDTFTEGLPERISLLHIDADWYASVSLCLETFYDRVTNGGVVLLDDFGYWEGCREAFYDFCAARRIKPVLERSGPSQAYWIKERKHNRDLQRP